MNKIWLSKLFALALFNFNAIGDTYMYTKFFKRFLDFTLSLFALVILSPLLLILTIIGSIAMQGNPFFVQIRPGKIDKKTGKEKNFKLVKFRTMNNKKDNNGKLLPDNARLNKYGNFLRSTSLDELPELWNILTGDMSIVGPRPLMERYIPFYDDFERKRHNVRPGLTGYAQANGRNTVSWDERMKLDVYYAENLSFSMDIKIIFTTVKIVLMREGIELTDIGNFDDYKRRKESGLYQ